MQHSDIQEYINTVCGEIRWKRAHNAISEEIEGHIIDQKNAFIQSGLDDKTATEKAIIEMGDPVTIGTELDRSYRPKIEWSIIALACAMAVAGLLVRIFTIYNTVEPFELSMINDFLSIIIGAAFMLAAYFLDFTTIGKYPKKIFFCMSVLLLVLRNYGVGYNVVFLPLMSFYPLFILFFPTAFAGIIYAMRSKGYIGMIQTGLIFLVPAVICLYEYNMQQTFIYSVSCLILLTVAVVNGWFNIKKSNALFLIYGSVFFVVITFIFWLFLARPYAFDRIRAAFNPTLDPQGAGWMELFVRNIVSGAELIGQGYLGEFAGMSLPGRHTDLMLAYLIHKFGWISFIIIMTIITVFIARLFTICKKQKSILAKLVSTSILITYTMQVFMYVVYNFGFHVVSPLTLPFFSYGGTSNIINMTLIGILLSIFNTGELYRDGISEKTLKV